MKVQYLHKNANGGGTLCDTYEDAVKARDEWNHWRDTGGPWIDTPKPCKSVGIFWREVTEWELFDESE